MVTCPLCGFRFAAAAGATACATCPVNAGCDALCCPNCRYHFLSAEGRRDTRPGLPAGPATLAGVVAGHDAVLGEPDPALDLPSLRVLVAYGLLPGTPVSVLRTSPAYVVRIGARTVSVDRTLATALRLAPIG